MRATWDAAEDRQYETGVDHGLLFPLVDGVYQDGVPWNGLTTVTESPSGAEATPVYADNMKYLNLVSAEEFAATIEALFYPPEFEACDGTLEIAPGVTIGQQDRTQFGFYYRTIVGNANNARAGYKHHFVYGCLAAPSEKAHNTVNDTPEATPFSWEVSTTAQTVGVIDGVEYRPTATLTINSLTTDPAALEDLLDIVYGVEGGADPRMPLPQEVAAVAGASVVVVNMSLASSKPTFVEGTGVLTLPAVTGVDWTVNGVAKPNGAQPAIAPGDSVEVVAHPEDGYTLQGDPDFTFERP
jgi:hypothetical protein